MRRFQVQVSRRRVAKGPLQTALLVAVPDLADRLRSQRHQTHNLRALITPANCKGARARSTTRTCCTPPRRSFRNFFLSLLVTSMRNTTRAIPQVWAKHF